VSAGEVKRFNFHQALLSQREMLVPLSQDATTVYLFSLEQSLILLHLHIHAFVKIQSDIKVKIQFQNSKLRQGSVKQMHIKQLTVSC